MHPVEIKDSRQTSGSRILILRSEKVDGDLEKRLEDFGCYKVITYCLFEDICELVEQREFFAVILDLAPEDIFKGLDVADTVFNSYGIAVLIILASVPSDEWAAAVLNRPYGIVLRPFRNFDLKVAIDNAHKNSYLYQQSMAAAETRVLKTHDFSRSLVQASPAYFVAVGVDGLVKMVNDAFLEALGYHLVQVIGAPALDLFLFPGDRPHLSGIFERLKAEHQVNEIEIRCRTRDGRPLAVVWNGRQVTGPDGRTEYYYGVGIDITERKKIEKIILDSEQKYRGIYESAPVGIFRSVKSGRLIDVNPYVVRMLGYESREELISSINRVGLDQGLYKHGQDRLDILKDVDARKGWYRYQSEFLTKTRQTITCRVDIRMLEKTDDDTIYEGFIEDISEQLRAEDEKQKLETLLLQAQKMEAIGTLAGGIAHDLNNILSPIIAFSELAKLNVETGGQAERYLSEVLTAALRARDLVKHILTFSRQSEIEKSPVNLNPLVKEAAKFLQASLGATIDINVHLHTDQTLVWADPSQIHQIIMNLCTNAAQAMKNTGGTLTIDVADVTIDETHLLPYIDLKPGAYVKMTFRDDGPGIPTSVMNRIFDPFYTTKERGEGTGLGLSVVHGIVKGMGGGISVYSELGEGTVFHVYLPKCVNVRMVDGVSECLIAQGRGRILFVDDEDRIVLAGLVILERLGYEVRTSTRSPEALEIFKQDPNAFDLVITDVTMPKMTGLELARRLIEIRPDLPILLCTGFSDMITPESMKDIGVRGVIMKPMIIKELAQAIQNALGRHQENHSPGA